MTSATSQLIGRFGNQMFQYAHLRAWCKRNCAEIRTPRWVGEKVFKIDPTPLPDSETIVLGGYCQNQDSAIYTQDEIDEWFQFRPEIERRLISYTPSRDYVVCHQRVGDFAGYGYPVVSTRSYTRFIKKNHPGKRAFFVMEECPKMHPDFIGDMAFVPDFWILNKASIIMRGNSSFSWWAAQIGAGSKLIYSPVVAGIEGGKTVDVEFVSGNHPAISDRGGATDIFIQ